MGDLWTRGGLGGCRGSQGVPMDHGGVPRDAGGPRGVLWIMGAFGGCRRVPVHPISASKGVPQGPDPLPVFAVLEDPLQGDAWGVGRGNGGGLGAQKLGGRQP